MTQYRPTDDTITYMNITQETINALLSIVKEANAAIIEVYNNHSAVVEIKADNSPLTQADKASHTIITKALTELFPEISVISEEGSEAENSAIVTQPAYWIVDPIDGTQDFVNRTGEFCIAIGLVDGDKPSFGFVSAPTMDTVYYGGPTMGSFKKVGDAEPEQIYASVLNPHVVAISRSHISEVTEKYITDNYPGAELKKLGSMLKQVALADGKVDVYPVISQPLHLWDVAAGQAIIEGAGGSVKRLDGTAINWHETADFKVGDFIAKAEV
ncbi:MAG: 3'(2'),5'-bisphosphate nucleotidase CysQ [Candidatus Microsaccharimonas sp.]